MGIGGGPQCYRRDLPIKVTWSLELSTTTYTSLKHTHRRTNLIMSDEEEMYESASDDYGSDLDMIDGTQDSESGKASLTASRVVRLSALHQLRL